MSVTALMFILTLTLFSILLIWMPLLQAAEAPARDYPTECSGDLLNLIEEDSESPFIGEVA